MTELVKADICTKTQAEHCRGEMPDPLDNYGEWAYWCRTKKDGWRSKPCEHHKDKDK